MPYRVVYYPDPEKPEVSVIYPKPLVIEVVEADNVQSGNGWIFFTRIPSDTGDRSIFGYSCSVPKIIKIINANLVKSITWIDPPEAGSG